MAAAILLLLAAVPCLYWTQGIETRPAIEAAGIKRLCAPADQADAWRKAGLTVTTISESDFSSREALSAPGVSPRPGVASPTRAPWIIASGWRFMVHETEPAAALGHVGTLSGQVADSVSEPRFSMAVLAAFAVLALGIAVTGLYGVLSYNVSQRRQEIGIRAALGATRADLVGLVVRQGLIVTLVGLGGGVLIAALAARRLEPLLFGIAPLDLPSFLIMPGILLIVATLACVIPARRAAATDPSTTLREE